MLALFGGGELLKDSVDRRTVTGIDPDVPPQNPSFFAHNKH
jgi:hypothetical protein